MPSFKKDAAYRRMLTHAMEVEAYPFDQLVARAGDAPIIKEQMLASIAPRR